MKIGCQETKNEVEHYDPVSTIVKRETSGRPLGSQPAMKASIKIMNTFSGVAPNSLKKAPCGFSCHQRTSLEEIQRLVKEKEEGQAKTING